MSRHSRSGSIGSRDSRRSSSHASGDSRDSTRTVKANKEAEFFNECRAAFIAIVGNPQDGVTSQDQLAQGRPYCLCAI